jgi:hypothetical protein
MTIADKSIYINIFVFYYNCYYVYKYKEIKGILHIIIIIITLLVVFLMAKAYSINLIWNRDEPLLRHSFVIYHTVFFFFLLLLFFIYQQGKMRCMIDNA